MQETVFAGPEFVAGLSVAVYILCLTLCSVLSLWMCGWGSAPSGAQFLKMGTELRLGTKVASDSQPAWSFCAMLGLVSWDFSHVPFRPCTIHDALGVSYLLPLAQAGVSWMGNSWLAQAVCLSVFTIAFVPGVYL